jgi:hypothetical protein
MQGFSNILSQLLQLFPRIEFELASKIVVLTTIPRDLNTEDSLSSCSFASLDGHTSSAKSAEDWSADVQKHFLHKSPEG